MAGERFGLQQTPGVLAVKKGGTGLGDIPAGSVLVANNLDVFTCATSTSGIWVLRNDNGIISWGDLSNLDIDTHTLDDHLDVDIAGSWGGASMGYPLVSDRDLLFYDTATKKFISGDYSAAGFGYASQLCVDNAADPGCLVRLNASSQFPYNYLPLFIGDDGNPGTSVKGAVPPAAQNDWVVSGKFLAADGTWRTPAGGGGETNTASNIGGFVQVFSSKVVLDLQFRTLQSSDGSVTITQNVNDIDFIANPANINAALTIGNGLAGAPAASYDGSAAITISGDYEAVVLPAKAATPAVLGVATTLSRSDHVHLVNDIGELGDVNLAGLANGDVLQYQVATLDWQNVALGAIFEPTVTWRDGLVNAAGVSDVDYNATNLKIDGGPGSNGALNTIQDIDATASPTFAGLTLSSLAGVGNRNIMVDATGQIVIDATGTGYWTRNGAGYLYPTTNTDDVGIAITDAPQTELEVGGDISLTEDVDRSITVLTSSAATAGGDLTIEAGDAGAGVGSYTGGNLILKSGDGGGSGGANSSGLVAIYGGTGDGVGDVYLNRNELGAAQGDTYLGSISTDLFATDILLVDGSGKIVTDTRANIASAWWTHDVGGWLYPTNLGEPVGIGAGFAGISPAEALEVSGNIALSKNANREIYNVQRSNVGIGYILGIQAGDAFSAGADYKGGALTLEGGDGDGVNYDGGDVHLMGGSGGGTGDYGSVYLNRGLGPVFAAIGSTYIGEVAQDVVSPRVLVYDDTTGLIGYDTRANLSTGVDEFTDLTDTPNSYGGSSEYLLQVNNVPDELEFIANISDAQHGALSNRITPGGTPAASPAHHPLYSVGESGFCPGTPVVITDDMVLGIYGWTALSTLLQPPTFNWRYGLTASLVGTVLTVDVDYDPLNLDLLGAGDTAQLTTIQDIHTSADVTFDSLKLNDLAGFAGYNVYVDALGNLQIQAPGINLWDLTGSDLYPINTSYNVSIGATAGAEKLNVAGNFQFIEGADRTIDIAQPASPGNGDSFYILAADANVTPTTGNEVAGNLYLGAGAASGGASSGGGDAYLYGGDSSGSTGTGGHVYIYPGDGDQEGNTYVNLPAGVGNPKRGELFLGLPSQDDLSTWVLGWEGGQVTVIDPSTISPGTAYWDIDGSLNIYSKNHTGYVDIGLVSGSAAGLRVNPHNTNLNSVYIGNAVGTNTITGLDNIGIGADHFTNMIGGNNNIAIGVGNLEDVVSGAYNIAVGKYVLPDVTGSNNIGLGREALFSAVAVTGNIAIGNYTLYTQTGSGNAVAIGDGALRYFPDVYSTVAIGLYAGAGEGTLPVRLEYGVFIGTDAGRYQADTASYNTFIGAYSGKGAAPPTASVTGDSNTGIGAYTLTSLQDGDNNVAIGRDSLFSLVSGSDNVFIGYYSGRYYEGDDSIGIGRSALLYGTGNNNIAIGYNTMDDPSCSGSNNVMFGNSAGNAITTGSSNVGAGYAVFNDLTTGNFNVAFGHTAAENTTTGSENVAIGYRALRDNISGNYNIAIGSSALQSLSHASSSNNNLVIGRQAADAATLIYDSLIFGNVAGGASTQMYSNVIIGYQAYMRHTNVTSASSSNVVIGKQAAQGASGDYRMTNSIIIGYQAADLIQTTYSNTIIGTYAAAAMTTGNNNTMYGYGAGTNVTTGVRNLLLGMYAGDGLTTESYQLAISGLNQDADKIDLISGDFNRNRSDDTGRVTINDVLLLPHRSGTPGTPQDGEIWTETDGVHVYINGSEYTLDMSP